MLKIVENFGRPGLRLEPSWGSQRSLRPVADGERGLLLLPKNPTPALGRVTVHAGRHVPAAASERKDCDVMLISRYGQWLFVDGAGGAVALRMEI